MSKKKVAIFGDLHLNRRAENPTIRKHIRDGQIDFFDKIIPELENKGVDTILFTGDIHDNRNTINTEALILTRRLLKDKFKNFNKHIILGNHDLYYENSYDISALELFDGIPNLTLHLKNVSKIDIFDKIVYFIPWIIKEKEENFIDFLKKLASKTQEEKDKTILFGHFEMLGIDMEGGSLSMSGMDSNLFLDGAKLTLSGHYHGKSIQEKFGNKLVYVGSPYPLTFANSDQEHGIWIMDENLNLEFIENKISPSFKTFYDFKMDDDLPDLSNSFVRFYFDRNKTPEELAILKMKLEAKNPIIINSTPYKEINKEEAPGRELERNANEYLSMDIIKLTDVYIEYNKDSLPETEFYKEPKDFIMKKMNSYMEEFIK